VDPWVFALVRSIETALGVVVAWLISKAFLDKEKAVSNLTTNDRYIRGGACMMKFGYRL
jgi:hypothetical protein